MKLLLVADLHLGARLDAWNFQATEAHNEIVRCWEEAVDLVTSGPEAIDGLLVAGDLFDAPEPEGSILDIVSRGLDRLVAAGKTVVLLPGIYDGLASPRSVYRRHSWPSGVTVVDWCRPRTVTLKVGEERLVLSTFAPLPLAGSHPAGWSSEPATTEGYRVGLFHAVTRSESPLTAWGPRLAADDFLDLGFDLLVVGGDHLYREALWSKTVMVSPGSPIPRTPREPFESAWTLALLSSEGVVIERRPRSSSFVPVDDEAVTVAMNRPRSLRAHPTGGLRGAFLRVYEDRLRETNDRAVLDAAMRYGLEELDRLEAGRVD